MSFSSTTSLGEFFSSSSHCLGRQAQYAPFTHSPASLQHTLFYMTIFTPYVHIIVSFIDRNKTNGLQRNIVFIQQTLKFT